ncbi:TOMM precursor leader peptide-binding protein [Streptomyces sp. CA2R101]|uniref:TOMM precursor leader peptide-binding protein n=1 Tax=Streptomyces sp. CA2R101 TaxID=3120152 RepID=UPI0030080BF3
MSVPQVIPFGNARVRIKRDVLFTETDEGVLFHNASGGFQLTGRSAYRFATLIVPYLNGEHTVRELCDMLPPSQQQMINTLVRMLMDRGLARDIPLLDDQVAVTLEPSVIERFTPQIEYIDHYEDQAAQRFHRFRTARLFVLGDDAVANWCATSAIRNGIAAVRFAGPAEVFAQAVKEAGVLSEAGCPALVEQLPERNGLYDWADLDGAEMVVCTGRQAPAQVVRLLSQGVPQGSRVLPLTMFGHRVVVGPLTTGDAGACWSCAMLRLGFNGEAGAAADVWRAVTTGGDHTGVRPGRHLSAILGNLLGFEAFREISGVLPPETERSVIVQEVDSFDTGVTTVLPHPLCTLCDSAGVVPDAPEVNWPELKLTTPPDSSVPSPTDEGPAPAIEPLDELTAQLVSGTSGVFREFDDEWPTQLPLKVSRLRFGTGTGHRRVVTAFDLHHVAGARMRALRAAAGEYLDLVTPAPVVSAERAQGTERIEPAGLSTFSGMDLSARTAGAWCLATSLIDGSEVLVPAAAVRPYAPFHNPAGTFTATTAGLGTGTSAADGAYRGLYSALAHLAVTTAIRSGARAPLVAPESLTADAELAFLLSSAENLGVVAELLHLPLAGAATVLLARTRAADGTPLWAIGADGSPTRAARTALRDLLGQCQILAERPEEPPAGHQLIESFDPYTLPGGEATALARQGAEVPAVLKTLRAAGYEPYAVADGSPDLRQAGLHAVRVLLVATRS